MPFPEPRAPEGLLSLSSLSFSSTHSYFWFSCNCTTQDGGEGKKAYVAKEAILRNFSSLPGRSGAYACAHECVRGSSPTFLPTTKGFKTKGDLTPVINILAGGWGKAKKK